MLSPIINIIKALRAPDGCPWDREQTPASIKKYLIEECFELIDAIDSGHTVEIMEELGDLLFMLIFLGMMYEEAEEGFIKGAINSSSDKMIRRHPHIFGEEKVVSTDQIVRNWQKIKEKEARLKGKDHSSLGNIPRALPALQRAYRMGERASRVGFDWPSYKEVLEKLNEEITELKEAIKKADNSLIEEELGDVLFTIANLSRHFGLNPEECLFKATRRFERRFKAMEEKLKTMGISIRDAEIGLMDEVWKEVKDRKDINDALRN